MWPLKSPKNGETAAAILFFLLIRNTKSQGVNILFLFLFDSFNWGLCLFPFLDINYMDEWAYPKENEFIRTRFGRLFLRQGCEGEQKPPVTLIVSQRLNTLSFDIYTLKHWLLSDLFKIVRQFGAQWVKLFLTKTSPSIPLRSNIFCPVSLKPHLFI